ncbi:antibiotic biosynthesis monooxygenase family protein [Ktedonobacter racemifer]|jgi:heme-degrading monooxygenase HmoA|uniref:Antibiotic biosynthesis monooxygenase n=1 Tax=Ktedonobacter racemifer DSM 44963 TaxID=485913 RepID=D6TEV1_KTERA|nr:antibiotic biosynthesis monooxygenase [Ktedonobacter racemifer]EFH88550.1 Antibiotic biosynthesis monooxygenase [Ktedonobacter racemifer DSM 44963]
MHVRTSIIRLVPGTYEEAIALFRDIILPSAQEQKGFKGAQIQHSDSDPNRLIVMSFWASVEDLLASEPPAEIHMHMERLDELIENADQDNYFVVHRM